MIFDPEIFDSNVFDVSVSGAVVSATKGGGGSKRKRRTWKTTEEIISMMRKEREFKYVPAPEPTTEPEPPISISHEVRDVRTDLDIDRIERILVERFKQEKMSQDIEKKRKNMAAIYLLMNS